MITSEKLIEKVISHLPSHEYLAMTQGRGKKLMKEMINIAREEAIKEAADICGHQPEIQTL